MQRDIRQGNRMNALTLSEGPDKTGHNNVHSILP
jgi:hypothetical protein